eukprot:TRINITY_DN7706_c0_g6_i1.p1 TRINITY_DN7706_c0_g6~~TRINITY_DN7706_c0_g6_i1.p1  ORF type:complete len:425 (+),score=93.96 TRINITY_DN7706_c0_g6_i1:170-1444(+)
MGKPTSSSSASMEQDFTPLVESKIPEYQALAKAGKLEEAVESLLLIEKQARVAEDAKATSKVCVAIVNMIGEEKRWDYLNEKLLQLSKRRGQLKMAARDFVVAAMELLDKTPDEPTRLSLIDTLRTITEGKIYVEVERARLTRMVAKLKEEKGDLAAASSILQEIQVETFGAMERREKIEFLLEQVRLVLDNHDYIRAQIISNKISRKALTDESLQDLKLRFYSEMIRYYRHSNNFLEVTRCYQQIYDTKSIKEDKEKWSEVLQKIVLFIILSPFNPEQADLLRRIYEDKNLQELPMYKDLLKWFITQELVRWPKLNELYHGELSQHHTALFPALPSGFTLTPSHPVSSEYSLWLELQKRVVEHNIRVVAKYYSKITSKRLAQLLDLNEDDSERYAFTQFYLFIFDRFNFFSNDLQFYFHLGQI